MHERVWWHVVTCRRESRLHIALRTTAVRLVVDPRPLPAQRCAAMLRPSLVFTLASALALTACSGSSSTRTATTAATHPAPRTLQELNAELEQLMRDHSLAEWNEYTHEQPVAEGTLDRLRAAERELFERARPLADAIMRRDDAPIEDRRRAQLWHDGALGLALVGDPEIARLSHQLEATLDAHVFERNGQRLTRADVRRLAMSADANERRAAAELESGAHRAVADIARQLFIRRNAVARQNGVESYGDEMLRLRGIEPARWDELVRAVETSTRPAYQTILTNGARAANLAHVTPADSAYVLTVNLDWTNDRLRSDDAVEFARHSLGAMGFDLDHPPVRVVVREFSFGGQTLAIHIPDDVRTVVRPQAGARFYSTLLHELGHGLQGTRTAATEAIFKGYEWIPALTVPGFDEGMAEVFGTMTREPDFLARFTQLTPDERTRLADAQRRNQLVALRSLMVDVAFEREALAHPEQDLDALERRLVHEIRLLDVPADSPPTWANSPFLGTYPMYRQSYALAAMVAAQVHAALRARFGDQWLTPSAAQFVTQTLLSSGEGVPWEDRLRACTGTGLEATALVSELTR